MQTLGGVLSEMGYNLNPPSFWERLWQRKVDRGADTELDRCLTIFPLVVQGVAHMLGAGIFVVTPSIVQTMAGPATFISYLLSGFAAALSVVCYSDLAGRYSCAGSAYVYTYFSLGEFAAAIVGFFLVGEMLIQAPMLGQGMSENLDTFLFNSTVLSWQEAYLPSGMLNFDFITVGTMLIFMVINMIGIKGVSYINIVIAFISFITLLVFNITALTKGNSDNLYKVVNPADGRTGFAPFGLSGIITGAGTAFFAFVGLESVVSLAEEAVHPKRDIPRATVISFVFVLIMYTLTAFSIAFFVPWYELEGTTGLIRSLEERGFVIQQYIVTAGLLFTVFSCGLCTLTTTVRIVYSIAEDGLLSPLLSSINDTTKVPLLNVAVCSVLGIFASIIYDFETLSHMISGGTLTVFVVTALAVLILSYDLTSHPEPSDTSEQTPLTAPSTGPSPNKFLFIILVCLFLGPSIILSFMIAFLPYSGAVLAVEIILGAIVLASLVGIWWKIPLHPREAELEMRSPCKPFLQGISVLVNLLLLLHLEAKALKQLVLYCIAGLIIYFCYGIFFSKMTVSKQKRCGEEGDI